ncbi:MAG TPA: glycosyltransferase [Casimicrobiaceae bacterium]|nr:glycosyltransferase [Casimicrobiaceae bacterium]
MLIDCTLEPHLTSRTRSTPGGRVAIAIVVKGYPRLSETFIAQELRALEQRGFSLAVFSLRRPTDHAAHPLHDEIKAPVNYLPEYLHRGPARVWRAWRKARRLPGYSAALAAWRRDLRRDFTRNRVRRFGQAMVLATELAPEVAHVHAHFLHTPASVARYAATMRGLAWSCSAHAKDVWTLPEWEKREKLDACAWLATCTACNAEHLRTLASRRSDVELIYHGIDVARFPAPDSPKREADGTDRAQPVTILTVGRAVDKKGFDDLLRALALLPAGVHWRMVHVGGGPLRTRLEALAHSLGIGDRVQWLGPKPHHDVLEAYRRADIFALPCRISDDGDRDGLPNVLLEAQSQRIACVSTRVSGVPELIVDGATGLLVEPRAPAALAAALARLIADPALRHALAQAGLERATTLFSLQAGADRLAHRFAESLAAADAA